MSRYSKEFSIKQGESFAYTFALLNKSDKTPYDDLTAYTAKMDVRDSSDAKLVGLTESSGIDLSLGDGKVSISLTAEQTAAFTVTGLNSFHMADLLLVSASGIVIIPIDFRFVVVKPYTHD